MFLAAFQEPQVHSGMDDSTKQDMAAAAGSTTWAMKNKPHDTDVSADRADVSWLSLNLSSVKGLGNIRLFGLR